MIRLIDYRCPTCGAEYRDVMSRVPEEHMDLQLNFYCGECNKNGLQVVCDRLPAAPGFVVHGFSAKNGYGPRKL